MNGETLKCAAEQVRRSRKYMHMLYKGVPIGESIVIFTMSDLREFFRTFKKEVIEMNDRQKALDKLHEHKSLLTYQQYRTFKGQICSGDIVGFHKGLDRILKRKGEVKCQR